MITKSLKFFKQIQFQKLPKNDAKNEKHSQVIVFSIKRE